MGRIYLVEGEAARGILKGWLADLREHQIARQELMHDLGANGAFRMAEGDPVSGMRFPNDEQPQGWTKPKANGFSRPKKGHPDEARLAALPCPQDFDRLISEAFGLPTSIKLVKDGRNKAYSRLSSKGTGINAFGIDSISHDGEELLFLEVPDFAAAEQDIRKWTDHEDARVAWGPDGTEPGIPVGMREITEAERDLMVAQVRVAAERANAERESAEEAAPAP